MTQQQAVLAQDPTTAIHEIIALSEKLSGLMEEEMRAITSNDSIAFMAAQASKEKASAQYQRTAQEFQSRSAEFKGIDTLLLDRLDTTQKNLGELTRRNITMFPESVKSKEESA